MKYQHYIFDLYGTLIDIHTDETSLAVWEKTCSCFAAHGADYTPDELREAYFYLVKQEERASMCSQTSRSEDTHEAHPEIKLDYIFQQLYQEKGVNIDLTLAVRTAQTFRRHSTRYIRLYDGAKDLLRALRQSGGQVWLLSNAQACFTRMELEDLGLLPFFDGICLSSDYGCKKPDRRFFESFLHTYHIVPESAIMIGNDGVCDIQGAKSVGLATLYIRSNLSPNEPMPAADYTLEVMNLSRVQDILL